MTFPFLTARQLRERFTVVGHFYELPSGRRCRSVLELLSHKQAAKRTDAQRGLPDAVVVMMNPGSSRPLGEDDWAGDAPDRRPKRLVAARPDTTQYQIMRTMGYMGWEHVRVVNLSDLHESKSSAFVRDYPALKGAAHIHGRAPGRIGVRAATPIRGSLGARLGRACPTGAVGRHGARALARSGSLLRRAAARWGVSPSFTSHAGETVGMGDDGVRATTTEAV